MLFSVVGALLLDFCPRYVSVHILVGGDVEVVDVLAVFISPL
jgi:hypothetical protein